MGKLTTDPNDPDIGRSGRPDEERVEQHPAYLILSDEERAKGFVRPLRLAYRHVGTAGPRHPTRPLTEHEATLYTDIGFVLFETYPAGSRGTGRYWSQDELDLVGKGCGAVTTMSRMIAETYARQPSFYGFTYCVGCGRHRPVGEDGEFVWDGTDERVGT